MEESSDVCGRDRCFSDSVLSRAIGLGKSESQVSTGYFVALDIWLFLTVLFANFATSLAEERGKAQADSLRKTRRDTVAYRLTGRRQN